LTQVAASRQRRSARSFDLEVASLLRCQPKIWGAYEIADVLRRESGPVSATQVYRALDRLLAQNVARRVESLNGYIAGDGCCGPILLCQRCGQVTSIDARQLAAMIEGLCRFEQFTATRPVLEILGHCQSCNSGAREPQT
jgi:Fur family zinc uptake transcriptional regulator